MHVIPTHPLQAAGRLDGGPHGEERPVEHRRRDVASRGRDGREERRRVKLDAVALVGADEVVRRVRRRLVESRIGGRVGLESEPRLVRVLNDGSYVGQRDLERADRSIGKLEDS